jgi:hypothetical protein
MAFPYRLREPISEAASLGYAEGSVKDQVPIQSKAEYDGTKFSSICTPRFRLMTLAACTRRICDKGLLEQAKIRTCL